MNTTNRSRIFLWANWFFLGNTLVFWLIGIRYLIAISPLVLSDSTLSTQCLAWVFVIVAYLGQLALLAFVPYLVVLPCIFFYTSFSARAVAKEPYFIGVIAVCVATIAMLLLITDTFIFTLYRFHLSGIVFQLMLHDSAQQIFNFSRLEYVIVSWIAILVLLVEFFFGIWLWQRIKTVAINSRRYDIKLITSLLILLFLSYDMFFLASTNPEQSFTQQTRALPLYDNIVASLLPFPNSLTRVANLNAGHFKQAGQLHQPLRYPVKELYFQPKSPPYNVVLIAIDSWRFDMINPSVTPRIATFAQSAWQFQHHLSGGNATMPGIFSLFYGIPATYTESILRAQKSPLFLQKLQQQNYRMGIFASAPLNNPPLDRSVFSGLKNLRMTTPGSNVYERDQRITQEFNAFIEANYSRPFFTFLFYDAAHSYCDAGNPADQFQPASADCNHLDLRYRHHIFSYKNRYKNAIYFVDRLVGDVIFTLKKKGLLENTIVIITSDHGQEFDDTQMGFWEHASNFTRYQTQVPLIVYWPKKAATVFHHTTTHYDVTVTLLKELLGCTNASSDFSVGKSLLTIQNPPYTIISSYVDFGIVTQQQTVTVLPTGNIVISDHAGYLLPKAKPPIYLLRQVFTDIKRFYSL